MSERCIAHMTRVCDRGLRRWACELALLHQHEDPDEKSQTDDGERSGDSDRYDEPCGWSAEKESAKDKDSNVKG